MGQMGVLPQAIPMGQCWQKALSPMPAPLQQALESGQPERSITQNGAFGVSNKGVGSFYSSPAGFELRS